MRYLLFLIIPAALAATNGLQQIGRGIKAKGIGGAGIALSEDAFSVNPAGLVQVDDRIDVGLSWLQHRAHFNNQFSSEPLFWPELGFKRRWCCDQALGACAYFYGQWKADYGQVRTNYGAVCATGTWSLQVNPVHSVGLALNVAYEWFNFQGITLTNSVAPNNLTNKGNNWEWGVSARIGWIGRFWECLHVGATYQTTTRMGHLRKYRGLIPGGGSLDLPQELGIGFLYMPTCNLKLALDVVKIFWRDSRFFRNGETANRPGSNSGPGVNWNEQVVFKAGALFDFKCVTIRLGWNTGNNPSPTNNQLAAPIAEFIQNHFTLGATYHMGCNELSIVYIHGFKNSGATQDSAGLSYGRRF